MASGLAGYGSEIPPDDPDSKRGLKNRYRFVVCCAICSQGIASDEISANHCGHLFHFTCIMYYFLHSCPSCAEYPPLYLGGMLDGPCSSNPCGYRCNEFGKFEFYQGILEKLRKVRMDNMELESKEVDSTIEKLKLSTENYKLKKQYYELVEENMLLKDLLMSKQ